MRPDFFIDLYIPKPARTAIKAIKIQLYVSGEVIAHFHKGHTKTNASARQRSASKMIFPVEEKSLFAKKVQVFSAFFSK